MAAICVREDGAYLESCLLHLISHGVDYAILDNGMDPDARGLLARPPFRNSLVALEALPFRGSFELKRQIEAKEDLFARLDVDWLIHLDVDEMMHPYVESERLIDSISRLDAAGFNAIDFDEFVFLPVEQPFEPGSTLQPVCTYYLFRPSRGPRLMRARKKSAGLTMTSASADRQATGHRLFGDGLHLAPERFALRHYLVRDQEHAHRKYVDRVFAPSELALGWHRNRVGFPSEAFTFPPAAALRQLSDPASRTFDLSDPKRAHYWQWRAAP